ncbi:hypothetical protein BDP81DRAFT_159248 [Colletotrichum phormii]|uniref:Uncharacterized protein n=1 Tax=Colletotrichum phormii TaxID=359342 RepID=A0AAI9ZXU1_9PEZI|nr:uncharacterized protein BDP81DRAFT_159248 [Colletotrichum phormii]KAK1640171.1 hypothetical protein BDP81DRAFT_159248 [Colletotrichum phormii]
MGIPLALLSIPPAAVPPPLPSGSCRESNVGLWKIGGGGAISVGIAFAGVPRRGEGGDGSIFSLNQILTVRHSPVPFPNVSLPLPGGAEDLLSGRRTSSPDSKRPQVRDYDRILRAFVRTVGRHMHSSPLSSLHVAFPPQHSCFPFLFFFLPLCNRLTGRARSSYRSCR